MNTARGTTTDDLKTFQLLSEVADETPVSQRELASRLGIALGLVNSYLKNFVAKGYIRIKSYPHNRYAYLLTPRGLAEKTRLAYQHVHYFTNLYTVTRQDYLALFERLSGQGIASVAFCGVDEVAEIAWLSLQQAGLKLTAVMDDDCVGSLFMGQEVVSVASGLMAGTYPIIITSLKRSEPLRLQLLASGVREESIHHPCLPPVPDAPAAGG